MSYVVKPITMTAAGVLTALTAASMTLANDYCPTTLQL
jgi:hypothetical protein